MVILSQSEHARLAEVIRQAERKTSGEIFCVLCRSSDDYFLPASFVLACMSILSTVLVGVYAHLMWIALDALTLLACQIAALALGLAIIRIKPGLRPWLLPKSLCYRRAHGNALRQFLAHNIHATQDRTGILIFVSLAERYAEIIADTGISEKVGQDEWNTIVGSMTEKIAAGQVADALEGAAQRAGALLAEHFPPSDDTRNELSDHVVEF